MDRERIFAITAAERRQIAGLLGDLDQVRLAGPSLCAGWDIKTVAAHLVSTLADGTGTFLWLALRRRNLNRAIDELARRRARRPAPEIIAALRRHADRRLSPPGAGPLDPLADVLVHSGDIRIPLGLPFEPDPEHAALALDFLTGPWRRAYVPGSLLRGIRLRGTDLDRSWGRGPEIRGPVAALMMAAGNRTALLDALDGPGLPTLRHRLTR